MMRIAFYDDALSILVPVLLHFIGWINTCLLVLRRAPRRSTERLRHSKQVLNLAFALRTKINPQKC